MEDAFVANYGPRLDVRINPDKAKNKYAPDLERVEDGSLVELKSQRTPFRSAMTMLGIPVRFAFTIDEYAAMRYALYYPDIDIMFWDVVNDKVYQANMQDLVRYLPTCYRQILKRRVDLGSKTDYVFVMDLRNEIFTRLV